MNPVGAIRRQSGGSSLIRTAHIRPFPINSMPISDRGNHLLMTKGGTTRTHLYDGLGSVPGEVDPLGNLTASRKYDVYGLVRAGDN